MMDKFKTPLFGFCPSGDHLAPELEADKQCRLNILLLIEKQSPSKVCILKDIDWVLRNSGGREIERKRLKEKNLKGERKVSPRVFNQSMEVYFLS